MIEFGLLLERQIPLLQRYARALSRNSVKADDLVQACLSRALEKQHHWQPGTDLRAWLFTLLHNLHVSEVRRSLRQQSGADFATSWAVNEPPAPDARRDLLDLDRSIAELPENQRRVVLLIGLEDSSYEEAAGILGVPVGTVRSRLGRARSALRRRLYRPAAPRPHRPTAAQAGPRTCRSAA